MSIDTGMCTQSLTLPTLQLFALPAESNTCFTINNNGDKFGNDDDNDNGLVMMGNTENDNETLCCRIMIMMMKIISIFVCSGNGNERNVINPTLVTLVVDHLAIYQYHIWPRQTWLCTSSMSWCVCSWLDAPASGYNRCTNFHNLCGKECSGPIVILDYAFHWPLIACFHDQC